MAKGEIKVDMTVKTVRAENIPEDIEIRHIPMEQMQTRMDDDGGMIVEGYAIVYNREADIWGDKEIILPGAATEALQAEDQYYLWQHDVTLPLSRKKIGTLKAQEDEKGVFIRAEFIDTQFGRDSYKNIDSGLVDKQSFAFRIKDARWEVETVDGVETWTRVIEKFKEIPEFSAVTFPAYEETTLQARMKEMAFRDKPKPEASGEVGTAVPEKTRDARTDNEPSHDGHSEETGGGEADPLVKAHFRRRRLEIAEKSI